MNSIYQSALLSFLLTFSLSQTAFAETLELPLSCKAYSFDKVSLQRVDHAINNDSSGQLMKKFENADPRKLKTSYVITGGGFSDLVIIESSKRYDNRNMGTGVIHYGRLLTAGDGVTLQLPDEGVTKSKSMFTIYWLESDIGRQIDVDVLSCDYE